MIFRRRDEETVGQKIRVWLWPRRSWARSIEFMGKRLVRLTASPNAIAIGVGAGVFASWTPFFGLHFVIAFIICYFLYGNYIAGAIGTFFGNPLTFPFILATSHSIGTQILTFGAQTSDKEKDFSNFSFWDIFSLNNANLSTFFSDVFIPILVGGIVPGIVTGIIGYYLARTAARVYQAKRSAAIAKRRQMLKEIEPQ